MTTFTGTIGFDNFIGANFAEDEFHFDATTLASTDNVVGGLSTDFGDDDILYLAAGTYGSALFAGVTGIDIVELEGSATVTLDSAMLAQGGLTGPDLLLQVRTSTGDDLVDASGATGNGAWFTINGGNDTILGSEGADVFSVNSAAAATYVLDGNGGSDTFYVGATGTYTLDGGSDTDDVYFSSAGDLWLDLNAAGIQFDVGSGAATGTLTGIERIHGVTGGNNTMYGSAGNDELFASSGADTLAGRGGNDALWGGYGDDLLRGGAGNDALLGQDGIDTADYAAAVDSLDVDLERAGWEVVGSGSTGTDTLYEVEIVIGGTQGDTMAGNAQANLFEGRGGHDILDGRDGADTLAGGNGRDILDGGSGDDKLYGDAGDDTLDGGEGSDRLFGGAGLDIADYSDVADVMVVDLLAGTGTDGGARNHVLINVEGAFGGSAGDRLSGDADGNLLEGRGGADDLSGREGTDILDGGAEADTLDGGADNDELTGGAGADLFAFTSTGSGYGSDTITDWQDGSDAMEFVGASSATVTAVGGDALIEVYDAGLVLLGTVTVTGAAGVIDAADYTLVP